MYKLTDRMIQHLEKDLNRYHELFQGGRCEGWQLEELIAKAIRSDFTKNEKVIWQGGGHNIGFDILVNDDIKIQIKSGKIVRDYLNLSGHRLGRFQGDLKKITEFLNSNLYLIIAIPYDTLDTEKGQTHNYRLFYIDTKYLQLEDSNKWQKIKNDYCAENSYNVKLEIHPSMSWQIWWKIPLNLITDNCKSRTISIE